MTNNTSEYWTIDGVSLHQLGWSVSTKAGRYGVPPLRGDDVAAAFAPGELWVPKVPGPRTLRLSMWMTGTDPATGEPTGDMRLAFNDNWARLVDLFWDPDRQFTIGRRWWRTPYAGGGPEILYSEALGQLATGGDVAMQPSGGPYRTTLDVDVRLAHPFFYGDLITTELDRDAETNIVNTGDWFAYSSRLAVDLIGPLTNPRVINTFAPGSTRTPIYCGLTGVIGGGETVTLDVPNWIALSSTGTASTPVNRSGAIYSSGTKPWMLLARGVNRLKLTATAGNGYARIRHRPPYL